MKTLDRNDVRILKGIIVKANKLITNVANITAKIEQIEDEYRRKCEEKKAQLEQDKEAMMTELSKFEGAVSTLYDCSLDEARDEIFNDEDNVVTDEETPEDTTEEAQEPEDDDLCVIDEEENDTELSDGDAIGTSPEELVEPMSVEDEIVDDEEIEDEIVENDDDIDPFAEDDGAPVSPVNVTFLKSDIPSLF